MARRLGEILIAKGLLTNQELDQALQTQLMSGGHLGTSLLDLGFIDERTLGETLAEMQGLGAVTRETLRKIPRSVIKLLPAALAEKHLAIPLKLEGNTLYLAVAAPNRLSKLSAALGYKIVPRIAPEVRIYEALDKHYGIPRRPRYARLCRDLDARPPKARTPVTAEATVGPPIPSTAPPGHDPTVPNEVLVDLPGATYGYGRDWREIAERLESEKPAGEKRPRTKRGSKKRGSKKSRGKRTGKKRGSRKRSAKVARSSRKSSPLGRLEEVLDRMCRAECKEDLAEAYLDYVSDDLATCMLCSVKAGTAKVWDCRGLDLEPEAVGGLRWTVSAGSVFPLLLGNSHYHGPVPDDPGCRHFYRTLKMAPPQELLLCPTYVNDRLVVIFYGDAGTSEIGGPIDTYVQLGEKLSLAMQSLILKMKIRAV
jgi:hypothetical protein